MLLRLLGLGPSPPVAHPVDEEWAKGFVSSAAEILAALEWWGTDTGDDLEERARILRERELGRAA